MRGALGVLKTQLRPSHLLWLLLSLLALTLSAAPPIVANAVRDDYFHNAEHMMMAVAGLLLGVPLSGIYRRLVNLAVSHRYPGVGHAALRGRARALHWCLLVGIMLLDLACMSHPVDAFVDRYPLVHAAEHVLIYALYALFGGALYALLESRPLAWLITLFYLAMLLMYLADENTVMNVQF